jgi:hypothetical protein
VADLLDLSCCLCAGSPDGKMTRDLIKDLGNGLTNDLSLGIRDLMTEGLTRP